MGFRSEQKVLGAAYATPCERLPRSLRELLHAFKLSELTDSMGGDGHVAGVSADAHDVANR